jgi:hypothetical protein
MYISVSTGVLLSGAERARQVSRLVSGDSMVSGARWLILRVGLGPTRVGLRRMRVGLGQARIGLQRTRAGLQVLRVNFYRMRVGLERMLAGL